MKRTALAASALSVAVLTGLTACGGSSDAGSGSDTDAAADKPKATASQAKEASVSPAERVAKLAITAADVGGYNVEEPSEEFIFAKSQDEVTLDKKVCAPLAYAMNQLPVGEPQADLTRVASNGFANGYTYVTLTAYEDGGKAESAMAGLTKAVASCGDGFTAKANGNTSPYDSVAAEPVTDKAGAGDESLAFKSTMTFRGFTHGLHSAAVRKGDIIAVYFSVNGAAIAQSRPSDAKLPGAVVEAQNAKLG
ncbi:hypothetical protein [Streptomyces sp. NPDC050704]|uniref:hypothetical protein n=1 Tax=Streptomyces sp. NPDC050704 TaxID=3157219 RepID=UPI00342DAB34